MLARTTKILRKTSNVAPIELKRARTAGVQTFFDEHVSQLERRSQEGDQCGFYPHLKEMDVEWDNTLNYEGGSLLRDIGLWEQQS